MDIFDFAGCGQAAGPLRSACVRWGIVDRDDVARFLAQASVESMGFKRLSESLAYSPERLLAVFKGRNGLNTLSDAQRVVNSGAQAIAEIMYGPTWGISHLGNVNIGDGYRFRGRGFLQTTGRTNYHATSMGCYGSDVLVETPDVLATNEGAAQSAAWYWYRHHLNGVTDIEVVTRAINGGTNALDERVAMTKKLLAYNRS